MAGKRDTTGTQKRKKKDPDAPKRPTTAFFYFVKHCRETRAFQTERVSDFTRICGERWKALTIEDKEQFNDSARGDRKRYDVEMAIFKPGKDPNKPKKPQTAFLLFVANIRPQLKAENLKNKDVLVRAGEMWRGLDDTEKEPFDGQAREAKKVYEIAMEKYNKGLKTTAAAAAAAPVLPVSPAKKAKVDVSEVSKNGAHESDDESEESEDEASD